MTTRNRYLGNVELIGSYMDGGTVRGIYSDITEAFAAVLARNIKAKHQNVVVVDGHTGSGKSNFAIGLCLAMDKDWDLEKNYIYSVADLRRKLRDPDANPISLFDEGSISLNSNNSQRRDDKLLVALFDTMRSRGWTTIICCPSMFDLNKRIRDHHVDYRCVCPPRAPIRGYEARGFVKLYKHVYREWGKSYWDLMGTGIFDRLKPRYLKRYEAIKKAHQDELLRSFIYTDEEEL